MKVLSADYWLRSLQNL